LLSVYNRAICRDIIIYRKAGFMNLFKINDIKATMSMLLVKDAFDGFLLEEAQVITFAKLVLNGKRNKNWQEDGEEKYGELASWKEARHILFEYIKGRKTPDVFKVFLKADCKIAEDFLRDSGVYNKYLAEKPELHMQIKYEKDMLCVITGIYSSTFTMDKTVEDAWDKAVAGWFVKNKISIENI